MTSDPPSDGLANRFLLALPAETLKRLRPMLEYVTTVNGQVVGHVDGPIEHLYLVNRGLVSIVKTMQDGRTIEIGAVGIEGLTNWSAIFGNGTAILDSIVQIPGTAYRIRREVLKHEAEQDAMLREMMQRYGRFAFSQLAQTAACNRLHSLEERCCRWLLIAHDNARSDTFPLTHEFLAMMLGVQRAGVSVAASILKKAGLIQYTRGRMTITDRPGLEDAACECYGAIQAELGKLYNGGTARYPRPPHER